MEKIVNRIMSIAVVILSLSGVIACSEIEALKPKAIGNPTFAGEPKTECALDPALLQEASEQTLAAQTAQPVELGRYSTQRLLTPYGVDLNCFLDNFMGPVYENVKVKFKGNVATKTAEFVLSINLPDVAKTYYFDSKNAITNIFGQQSTGVGDIQPDDIFAGGFDNDGSGNTPTSLDLAPVNTQYYAMFEYDHHDILLDLTKINQTLNLWKATITVFDKAITAEDYEGDVLGYFEITLDNNGNL